MLADLIQKENEAALEQEFYKYQYDELEAAQLIADEQMNIEEELKLLMHAEEIKQNLHHQPIFLTANREHSTCFRT